MKTTEALSHVKHKIPEDLPDTLFDISQLTGFLTTNKLVDTKYTILTTGKTILKTMGFTVGDQRVIVQDINERVSKLHNINNV